MKRIKLTQGQYALVDDEDFEYLGQFKWCAAYYPCVDNFYADRAIHKNGKTKTVRMHRLLLNAPQGVMVDHINHNTLDNRKHNLRLCTNSQNQRNRKGAAKHNSSCARGVSWHKHRKKWQASIRLNGKPFYLGIFKSPQEASKAYEMANKKYYGEFGGVL